MKLTKLLTLFILVLGSAFILAGCSTQTVSQGDLITVSYDSYLQDGKLIEEGKQIQFTVGMGETFPIFDKEVEGMKLLGVKEFTANADEGYGVFKSSDKIQNITATVFNTIGQEPTVGEMIELGDMKGLVLEVGPVTVKIDFNGPETRETVEFKIKILEIQETK